MERPAKNHDVLIKQIPVEAAVLDRFEQVVRSDRIRAGENGGPGATRARMPTCQESRHDVFGLVLSRPPGEASTGGGLPRRSFTEGWRACRESRAAARPSDGIMHN